MPKDAACSVEGCGGRDYSRGFCHKHYSSWRRYGDPTVSFRRRKGTGSINKNGYKVLTINKVQILEHRWVMEQAIGRPLLPHEQVHHVNGNRLDNRLENLELWSTSQPPGQRVSDKVAWAREILTTYGQLFPEEGR